MVDKQRAGGAGGSSNPELQMQTFMEASNRRLESIEDMQKKMNDETQRRMNTMTTELNQREEPRSSGRSYLASLGGTPVESNQVTVLALRPRLRPNRCPQVPAKSYPFYSLQHPKLVPHYPLIPK